MPVKGNLLIVAGPQGGRSFGFVSKDRKELMAFFRAAAFAGIECDLEEEPSEEVLTLDEDLVVPENQVVIAERELMVLFFGPGALVPHSAFPKCAVRNRKGPLSRFFHEVLDAMKGSEA